MDCVEVTYSISAARFLPSIAVMSSAVLFILQIGLFIISL